MKDPDTRPIGAPRSTTISVTAGSSYWFALLNPQSSGGTLRWRDHAGGSGGPERTSADRALSASCGHDIEGGWLLPRAPHVVVDHDYVLAAAGLLAQEHPRAARSLLGHLVDGGSR